MRIIKIIWIIAAFLFLTLGIIGITLPILPTTPFFIAASFCFAKGSKRLKIWFMSTSFHRKYIQSFYEKKGMTLKNKITILLFASIMLMAAFYFSGNLHARILIIAVTIIKYYIFIFKIKTIS